MKEYYSNDHHEYAHRERSDNHGATGLRHSEAQLELLVFIFSIWALSTVIHILSYRTLCSAGSHDILLYVTPPSACYWFILMSIPHMIFIVLHMNLDVILFMLFFWCTVLCIISHHFVTYFFTHTHTFSLLYLVFILFSQTVQNNRLANVCWLEHSNSN